MKVLLFCVDEVPRCYSQDVGCLKETTGGEFRVYRASIRLLSGIFTFYKAPIAVTTHLKMS